MAILLAILAWLLTYLAHSTLLLGGAVVLTALGMVRAAAAREMLWRVALLGGLLTATAQSVLRVQPFAGHLALDVREATPFLEVASVRPAEPAEEQALAQGGVSAAGAAFAPAEREAPFGLAPAAEARPRVRRLLTGVHVSWPGMLLHLWLVGIAAFGGRLVWMRLDLARRLRGRAPVRDGPLFEVLARLAREAQVAVPRLSVSDLVRGPVAFAREIVLPARLVRDMDLPAKRAVLAHELGHIVRRDPAWLVFAGIVESVLFLQPLNRVARRRLQECAEYLCDAWAAERAGGIVLARCLAEVALWMRGSAEPVPVAGMAERCSQLVARVQRLLEGGESSAPAGRRWAAAASGAAALALVAWAVPGVAARDLEALERSAAAHAPAMAGPDGFMVSPVSDASGQTEDTWAVVRGDGRLLVLNAGWSARLVGQGRIGFRHWGRVLEAPVGWRIEADGRVVRGDMELCVTEPRNIRIVGPGGAWEIRPVRIAGATRAWAFDGAGEAARRAAVASQAARSWAEAAAAAAADAGAGSGGAVRHGASASASARVSSGEAALDAAFDAQFDAAIDSIVELWNRDPEAARRFARRIARTFERDLKPHFERLGVVLGNELTPELARLTGRVADLTPEFERMGAAIGQALVSALADESEATPRRYRKPGN